uniref:Ras modification protein ERF4 n=1 Tax=Ciona savignyi TaxID=51511 RepID=H2YYU1_CIOSA
MLNWTKCLSSCFKLGKSCEHKNAGFRPNTVRPKLGFWICYNAQSMQAADDLLVKKRIYIQRDYSNGMAVRFQTRFPNELDGKISPEAFAHTISVLNEKYQEAEQMSCSTYCESCMACLTGYLLLMCIDTHYKKVLKSISKYIDDQNNTVYWPKRILIKDPFESGLRSIEIVIFDDN